MKSGKKTMSKFEKQASMIKINKKLDDMENTPFFKKKMEKGKRILSIAGIPKGI